MSSLRAYGVFVTVLLGAAAMAQPVQRVSAQEAKPDLGPFTSVTDIGGVRQTLARHDRSSGIYFISAVGINANQADGRESRDALGFVWKEMKGDASISARVRLMGRGEQPHRKAGVMLRQSLAPEAMYVEAMVHGDGLTALRFRTETGGPTLQIRCAPEAPTALRLEKRGDHVQLLTSNEDGVFFATGCQVKLALGSRFQAGLAVWAPDGETLETARFSSVTAGLPPERRNVRISAIEMVDVESRDRRILWYSSSSLEVPSFTATGDAICLREDGQLKILSLVGRAEPRLVDAGNLADCQPAVPPMSAGQRLEHRVERGRAQIWLEPHGGKAIRLTSGNRNHWQPRLAPDAASFAYLSGDAKASDGHPGTGDYLLVQRPLPEGAERTLAQFHGGAGSLGISPWSPDGRRVVFVSREPE